MRGRGPPVPDARRCLRARPAPVRPSRFPPPFPPGPRRGGAHRPRAQVVGVAKADAAAEGGELGSRDAFGGTAGTHGHENGAGNGAVRQP